MSIIQIYSHIGYNGGSENRCLYLSHAIQKYIDGMKPILTSSTSFHPKIKSLADKFEIETYTEVQKSDILLIINSDSQSYSTKEYFEGKSPSNIKPIDLSQFDQIIWLYNFIVSPSRHLEKIDFPNKKIITTNSKFFNEISNKREYENIRILPRMILRSPIDPETISVGPKNPVFTIGCTGHSLNSKWHKDWPKLISNLTTKLGKDNIQFKFMEMPGEIKNKCPKENNITFYKFDEIPVITFLNQIDVYCMFDEDSREEPLSRSLIEGVLSGKPALCRNKGGNPDIVVNGMNGFHCSDVKSFEEAIFKLYHNPDMYTKMSKNGIMYNQDSYDKNVVEKLLNFINY